MKNKGGNCKGPMDKVKKQAVNTQPSMQKNKAQKKTKKLSDDTPV